MIRVLVADDQPLVRSGFRMVIEERADLELAGEASDGAQALELARELDPDVILMDVRMPNLDGVEATRRLVESGTRARILVLTTFDLDEYVYAALRAGAGGFLLKDVPPADLVSAIRAVAGGDAVVAPSVTRRLIEAFAPHLPDPADGSAALLERLTEREREVLQEVARGRSNQEIAAALVVSEATVKTHVGRLLTKLDTRDRVGLVVFAYEAGLVRRGSQ